MNVSRFSTRRKRPGGPKRRITGVVLGILLDFTEDGRPRVDFPENPAREPILARYTGSLGRADAGRCAALAFEGGDPASPVVLGIIQDSAFGAVVNTDGEERIVTLKAKEQLVLRCGDASITLTRAGKVVISGKYVLSRSTGVNMVQGATVHLN